MAGPSQISPVTDASRPFADSDRLFSPVLMDSSVKDLTGDLEETDNKPFACGGYSLVYKYRARNSTIGLSSGSVFAVKSVSMKFYIGDNQTQRGLNKLKREIEVWVSLNHKNVLKLHGVLYRDGILFPSLVSDFMENGTACDYLRKNPEANFIFLIRDIAKGLSYMHGKDVAHGDIKGDNVLITDDGCARIGDFGLSRTLGQDGSAIDLSTTDGNRANRWTAMEYLDFSPGAPQGPTKAGDVWSLGCTILQLFSGKLPYHDAFNDADVVIRLARPKQELPSFPPSSVRSDFERFRKGVTAFCHLCWIKDPIHRPTIDTLESIICSYSAEVTCDEPGELIEAPHDFDGTRPGEDIKDWCHINDNGTDLPDGPRSRSSSQSTIIQDSGVEHQIPDLPLPEPLAAEPEEPNMDTSPTAIPSEHTESDDLSNPFLTIPPPPVPSLESILHYKNKSAQSALNELCQTKTTFAVRYVDGESAGPGIFVVNCIVNDEEYGLGVAAGRKKLAKERAALAALERIYFEYPAYFPTLRYSLVLTSYLNRTNLSTRATWTSQSGPSMDNPENWVYRRTFSFDGIPVAEGVGPTHVLAEEEAARNVGLTWRSAASCQA